ncbi:MAG: flagellar hook-basal body complex protein, partial [Pseudomonadota bacterium]
MDNPGIVTLTRQSALLREMQMVANNIANASTAGYRREGVVFAEIVERLAVEGGALALTDARVRLTDFGQGALDNTGNQLDFAIEGEGFFQVETDEGTALTRAGNFAISPAGELVTADGRRVLDLAGAAIFVPAEGRLQAATDGTLSVNGQAVGQLGVVTVEDPSTLTRRDGTLFETEEALVPSEDAVLFQGFVEQANVDPIKEVTRLIEVQRAYEMGQTFLADEHERQRQVIQVIGQQA